MPSSSLLRLHAFHRQLYAHAIGAAQPFTALNTKEIAAYSRSFQDCLPSSFTAASEEQILRSVPDSRFLLFGDFHTLGQSQRGFLHLLAKTRKTYPDRPLMVALEIFNASDQMHIDAFQSGAISEEQLLKKIDYHNKWGFPWENYRPIVQFCLRNRIPLTGINGQFDSSNRLTRRDEYAATILNRWARHSPESFCFCLIGEYHLADRHLLAQLKPEYRTLRIVANVDDFALKTMEAPIVGSDYLQLAPDFYCLLNTSPWVKWQSLVMWEEMHATSDQGSHPDDLYTEHHYDFDYQLLNILKALNSFLELGLSSSDLTYFDLYFKPDRATLSYLKSKLDLDRHEIAAAEKSLSSEGFYYFSPVRAIAIEDVSVANFAEAAGHLLYDILHYELAGWPTLDARIERHVCSSLAKLLMNPRQVSHRDEAELKARQLPEIDQTESLLQLLLDDKQDLTNLANTPLAEVDRQSGFILSRRVGETLGTMIFQNLWQLSDQDFLPCLQTIFKGKLSVQINQIKQLIPLSNRDAS